MMRVEAPLKEDYGIFLDEDIEFPYVFCEPGGGGSRYELFFEIVNGTLFLKDKVVSGNVYITNRPKLDNDVKSGDSTQNSIEYQLRQKQIYYDSFYDVLPSLFEGSGFVSSSDEVGEVVLFDSEVLPKNFVSLMKRQSADRYRLLAQHLGTFLNDTIRTVRNFNFIDHCFSNAEFGKISGYNERNVIYPIGNPDYRKEGKPGISPENYEQYVPYIPIYDEINQGTGAREEEIEEEVGGAIISRLRKIIEPIRAFYPEPITLAVAGSDVTFVNELDSSGKRIVAKRAKDDTFTLELEYDFTSIKDRTANYIYIGTLSSGLYLTIYSEKKDIKLYFANKNNYDLYLNEKPSLFLHPAMYLPSRDDDNTQYLYTNKGFTQSGTLSNLNYRTSVDVKRTTSDDFGFYKIPVGIKTFTNYFGDSFNDNSVPMSFLATDVFEIGRCQYYFGDEYPSSPRYVNDFHRSFVINIPKDTKFLRISSPEVVIQCIVAFDKDKTIADSFNPFYVIDAEEGKNIFSLEEIPTGFLYVCNDARLLPRKIIIIR